MLQLKLTLQLLWPELMMQEAVGAVSVPDIVGAATLIVLEVDPVPPAPVQERL
jgi:hypothetical protein